MLLLQLNLGVTGNTRTYLPTGTIVFSLGASQLKGSTYTPTGSLLLTGTAPIVFTSGGTSRTISPSGSILYTGTVVLARGHVQLTGGSLLFSSNASYTKSNVVAVTGGIGFNNSSSVLHGRLITPSGILVLSGTTSMEFSGAPATGQQSNRALTFVGT